MPDIVRPSPEAFARLFVGLAVRPFRSLPASPSTSISRFLRQAASARGRRPSGTLDFGAVSHPSIGRPPRDPAAGFPAAAERLRANRARIAGRALAAAAAADPTLTERYDETGLRRLLRDAEVYLDRIALSVESDDPSPVSQWAEMVHPVYRRRRVPMDDLVTIGEGLRRAIESVLSPEERVAVGHGIDDANAIYRRMRRLGGDARKRNPILAAIYKGG